MVILVPLLLVAVFVALWVMRRGATLTRVCRWREDRAAGVDLWRCAVCGAVTQARGAPRHCLRGQG
ncbi:hypothetical protein [Paragemmobacter ruber]|uniref:Uncharacterized protein n=1 Tax=Paragemmobacter ruber TaxID=1985673 RepID=A0ABW9Y5K4_9RHOB|nr:hypothetical protein [Rhodobacter ruber]NBE07793.1 hypothetical protein [Rhodobacter ruber]